MAEKQPKSPGIPVKAKKKVRKGTIDWNQIRADYVEWIPEDGDDSFVKFCKAKGISHGSFKKHTKGLKEERRQYQESIATLRQEESTRRLATRISQEDERIFNVASGLLDLAEGTVNHALKAMNHPTKPQFVRPSSLREIGSTLRASQIVMRTSAGKPIMGVEHAHKNLSDVGDGERLRTYRDQLRALSASGANVDDAFLSYMQMVTDELFGPGEKVVRIDPARKALKGETK